MIYDPNNPVTFYTEYVLGAVWEKIRDIVIPEEFPFRFIRTKEYVAAKWLDPRFGHHRIDGPAIILFDTKKIFTEYHIHSKELTFQEFLKNPGVDVEKTLLNLARGYSHLFHLGYEVTGDGRFLEMVGP